MAENTGITVDTAKAEALLGKMGREFERDTYLKLVGMRGLNWVNENFRKGGTEHAWRPLSPNTIASRRGGGAGGVQILRDTGRMAQSFSVSEGSEPSVAVGTEDKKAKWHHEGTRPYTIRSRSDKPLSFMTAGGRRFAMSVDHPGLPKRQLVPSERLAEKIAVDVLEAFVRDITRE